MDPYQARQALLGLNVAIGAVFLLFPKQAMRLYGVDPSKHAPAAYPVRYVGARSLLFVALLMEEDDTETLLRQLPVVAGADLTATALATVTGEVPKRTVLLGALTIALSAGLGYLGRD